MRRDFAFYGFIAILSLGCGSRAYLERDESGLPGDDDDTGMGGSLVAAGGTSSKGGANSSAGRAGSAASTGGASNGGTTNAEGGVSQLGGEGGIGNAGGLGGVGGLGNTGGAQAGFGGVSAGGTTSAGGANNGGTAGTSATGGFTGAGGNPNTGGAIGAAGIGGVGGAISVGGAAGIGGSAAGAGGVAGTAGSGTAGSGHAGGAAGAMSGGGAAGGPTCIPKREVCDGRDNDCNGTIDGEGVCPCEFQTFRGHSYQFCKPARRWEAAQDYCRSLGYELVTIENADENTWLGQTAYGYLDDRWWMGFNDITIEGFWVWASGHRVTYTNWDPPDEPNNSGGGEDCAQLNRWYPRTTWNDEPCRIFLPFICESF